LSVGLNYFPYQLLQERKVWKNRRKARREEVSREIGEYTRDQTLKNLPELSYSF
jgi:hypothetical protein